MRTFLVVFGSIFGGIGVVLAVVGGFLWNDTSEFDRSAEQATGTVVGVEERWGNDSRAGDGTGGRELREHAVIAFTADGRDHEFTSDVGRTSAPEIGSEITVSYDPDDPADAREGSGASLYLLPLLLVGLGALFTIVGAVTLGIGVVRARRRRALLETGETHLATVTSVEEVTNVRINGRHPWVVVAQFTHPAEGIVTARSESVRQHPDGIEPGTSITVRADPGRPQRNLVVLPRPGVPGA